MRTKTREVYIAKDGKEFLTELACIEHEKMCEKLRFYRVHYYPDLTEKGCFTETIAFAIEPYGYDFAEDIIEKYCFEKFGFGCGVQGYGFMKYFRIERISKADYDNATKKAFIGYTQRDGFPTVFNYLEKWNIK